MYNEWFQQPWATEIVKQFRYPGRVKFTMDVSPRIETWTGTGVSGTLAVTKVSSIVDGDCTYCPAANLEGLWKADGSAALLSSSLSENRTAVWSEAAVSKETPMVLQFNISESSIAGVILRWDATYQSWATLFTLEAYDAQGVLINSLTVANTQPLSAPWEQMVEFPADNMRRLRLTVLGWSKPEQRARVSSLHFGLILSLTEQQIVSISEQTQCSPICARLPADAHKYTLRNSVYKQMTADIQGVEVDGYMVELPLTSPDAFRVVLSKPSRLCSAQLTWLSESNAPARLRATGLDGFNREVYATDLSVSGSVSNLTLPGKTIESLQIQVLQWSGDADAAALRAVSAIREYGNSSIPSEVNNLFDPSRLSGVSKYLAQRQKIEVQYGIDTYDGSTLWLPTQTRFLDAWTIPQDKMAVELQSSSRLSFLTSVYTKGKYSASNTHLWDLADTVLRNSSIIKDKDNQTPWEFSQHLEDYYTDAPLPMRAENVLLQLIAQAAGCFLISDPEHSNVVFCDATQAPFLEWQVAPYTIDQAVQLQQPKVTLETPLKLVQVYQYKYVPESAVEELYKDTLPKRSGTYTYELFYKDSICATDISVSVTNATVVSQELYGYKTVLTLKHNSAADLVTVTIQGHKVTSSKSLITMYTNSEVESGKEIVVDNPLVTNMDTVERVASAVVQHYLKRVQVETSYLGYPDLKSSANTVLYSDYANGHGQVVETKLEYNGAYSGNLTILMED